MQQIEDKIKAFWVKWLEADELGQLRLVESLSLPTNVIKGYRSVLGHGG